MKFYFRFGGREYSVDLNIVSGATPWTISHEDIESMGRNYQKLYKTIDRPEDSYQQKVEMRNYLPFPMFPENSFLSTGQLKKIRNLGHPSVKRQIRVIEDANLEGISSEVRKKLYDVVKHCKACPLTQGKPRRFLFSVNDPIIGEFNHHLQIDVFSLCQAKCPPCDRH